MNKIIGQNLCKFRKANNFTQEQVAEYLGINRSTYSNYELGEREMPFELLERSADLFGCDLAILLEEDEALVDELMLCSFRIDDLSANDLKQIAAFKRIVKNYMKMNQLQQAHTFIKTVQAKGSILPSIDFNTFVSSVIM